MSHIVGYATPAILASGTRTRWHCIYQNPRHD
nr:MAG TPA: hypothetical protein [Caudoviricetes sp.]